MKHLRCCVLAHVQDNSWSFILFHLNEVELFLRQTHNNSV